MKDKLSRIHGTMGSAIHALSMHPPDILNIRHSLMDAAGQLGEILRKMPDDAVVVTKPVLDLPKARTIRMGKPPLPETPDLT